MRRLILLLLLIATVGSTGCIAAVPLLIYAHRNRTASAEPPGAAAVNLASHQVPIIEQPEWLAK